MGPGLGPTAVVVFLRVSWEDTRQERRFALRLLDDDGHAVLLSKEDEKPVCFSGEFGAQDGIPDSAGLQLEDIYSNLSINIPPLPLELGRRYRWVFEVDDYEIADAPFVVRSTPIVEP